MIRLPLPAFGRRREPPAHAGEPARALERQRGEPGPAQIQDERHEAGRRRMAWLIALAADFTQIVLMPLFGAGGISPANDLLDLIVCVFMVRLLGWHPAFLPTFIAELVPVLDLIPTWTAAVWFVTRLGGRPRSAPR